VNARQIDAYLRKQGSPLAGQGQRFVKAGKRHGFDPLLLVAISGAESSFGKRAKNFNPFGWGPHIPFKSWGQAIDTVARGLKRGYFDAGLKDIASIGKKWAPVGAGNDPTNLNSNWTTNVTRFYGQLGGAGVEMGVAPQVRNAVAKVFAPSQDAMADAALGNLGEIAATGRVDPVAQLTNMSAAMAAAPEMPDVQAPAATPLAPAPAGDFGKWVRVPTPRGNSSKRHQQPILRFVGTIAQDFGKPLSVWDNTTHSRTTVNGNESAHYGGNAADIPARGAQLKRLGYIALVRAGMSAAEAKRASRKGGLFNVGGYQIIFATNVGGNHYDHLHVGIRS
jgi:hypothetical protein